MSGFWTEARVDKLRELLADGLSAMQAAEKIGATRNAVIGIAHRKGLALLCTSRKPETPKREPGAATKAKHLARVVLVAAPVAPVEVKAVETFEPEAMFDKALWRLPQGPVKRAAFMAPKDCRYPFGDVGDADFGFCGEERRAGSSYCAGHHRLCHSPARQPAAKAAERIAA